MEEIQIFNNAQFGNIRGVEIDGEPWVAGKDICAAFGDTNHSRSLGRIGEEDKRLVSIQTAGGKQTLTFINESGLYALLFAMQPQKANHKGAADAYPLEIQKRIEKLREFKYWVTHDVLPSIRKHGAYLTPQKVEEVLLNPDTIIQLATELKREREERARLEAQHEVNKPKVALADAVIRSDDTISVGTMAKILEQNGILIGRNRLFKALREMGLLMIKNDYNIPTQYSIDNGWFNVDEYTYIDRNGQTQTGIRTRVTGKGQQYLVNRFLRNKGE